MVILELSKALFVIRPVLTKVSQFFFWIYSKATPVKEQPPVT
jgi:hypothetical protein